MAKNPKFLALGCQRFITKSVLPPNGILKYEAKYCLAGSILHMGLMKLGLHAYKTLIWSTRYLALDQSCNVVSAAIGMEQKNRSC